jgi:hypothetical protein
MGWLFWDFFGDNNIFFWSSRDQNIAIFRIFIIFEQLPHWLFLGQRHLSMKLTHFFLKNKNLENYDFWLSNLDFSRKKRKSKKKEMPVLSDKQYFIIKLTAFLNLVMYSFLAHISQINGLILLFWNFFQILKTNWLILFPKVFIPLFEKPHLIFFSNFENFIWI